jgi:hypothetical protein
LGKNLNITEKNKEPLLAASREFGLEVAAKKITYVLMPCN